MEPTVVVLWMGGIEATVDLASLSGVDWRDMRRATGLHQVELLEGLQLGDFDCQAAFMWVAARSQGGDVGYEQMLAAFSYETAGVGPSSDEGDDVDG